MAIVSIGSQGSFIGVGGAGTQAVGSSHYEPCWFYKYEDITLSTSGTTTDSTSGLLPGNATIVAVYGEVRTTITTAANYSIGITGTGTKFASASTNITAGTFSLAQNQWDGAISTSATGPTVGASDTTARITTNANPGAGVVRLHVFGWVPTVVAG